MTDDLQAEYRYRYHERIGMMVGEGKPTADQVRIAKQEAALAVAKLSRKGFTKAQKSEE